MSDLALELAGVTKEFPGVRALDNVTLRVRRGEIHALVGENGAGKSTLMKILGGIYPHGSFEGGIRIRGEPFRFHSPHDAQRKGIGFVPQEIGIIENLTVAENIFVGRWTGGGWSTSGRCARGPNHYWVGSAQCSTRGKWWPP